MYWYSNFKVMEILRIEIVGDDDNGCDVCGEAGYMVVECLITNEARYIEDIELLYVCGNCGNVMERDEVYDY